MALAHSDEMGLQSNHVSLEPARAATGAPSPSTGVVWRLFHVSCLHSADDGIMFGLDADKSRRSSACEQIVYIYCPYPLQNLK